MVADWTFSSSGKLILPIEGIIQSSNNITLSEADLAVVNQQYVKTSQWLYTGVTDPTYYIESINDGATWWLGDGVDFYYNSNDLISWYIVNAGTAPAPTGLLNQVVIESNSNQWKFEIDGSLTLPQGSRIGEITSDFQVTITDSEFSVFNQTYTKFSSTLYIGVTAPTFHIVYVDPYWQLQDDIGTPTYQSFNLITWEAYPGAEVVATPTGEFSHSAHIIANGQEWNFGADGSLTLPTILSGDTSIGTAWNTNPPEHTLTLKHNSGVSGGSGGEIKFDYGSIDIKVIKDAGTTQTWNFSSTGTLTFPDSTVQSIAYRPIIDTTYDELFALKTASELIPGVFYKITDFASIYDQPDFDSNGTAKLAGDLVTKTGPTEPLIVLAITVNAIAPQAWSTIYTGDTILYDIDYVSTIVKGTPCKGRIEFRKDSNNNQIPYDSRGILLKRYETISGSQVYDSFKDTGFAYRDDIPTFGDECENIVLTAHPATYGQGPGSDASIFLVTNNAFGLGCESIIASGGDFVNNTFGNFVFGIHVAHSFRNNSFGAGLADCHFLNNFANNRIGEGFINNIIENDFFNNVIGNNFQDNDIGSEFQDNTIGDGFTQNSVGNGFKNNIIGSIFTGNHINDYFQNNGDIGDNFSNNDIRYRFSENTIASNFQFNLTKTIITGTNFTATTSCYQTYTSEIVTPAATPESSTGEAYIGYLDVSTLQWVWTHV